LFIDSEVFKESKIELFYDKRQQVLNATTDEAVENIVW
jgi:hypothetical protein